MRSLSCATAALPPRSARWSHSTWPTRRAWRRPGISCRSSATTRNRRREAPHMEQAGYLARLTLLLAERLARLPAEVRARHAAYLRAAQLADGSFPDREGGPDLYYTGFGLRGLALLGELTPEISQRA